jgi:SET domain-containing protein
MKYKNIIIAIVSASVLFLALYLLSTLTGLTVTEEVYLDANDWSSISNKQEYERKGGIKGIEVRVLQPPHILAGEKGVFATKDFSKYDCIGEYTGIVKTEDDLPDNGLFTFHLKEDVSIDATDSGNELRYINSYLNIAVTPNVICSITHINKKPSILYICTKDIIVGEELLIDYGEEYNDEFILKKHA